MSGLNLGVNTRSINHLDNLMGAKEIVKQCARLDQGYCEKHKAWCYIIQSCETKGMSAYDKRAAKIKFNKQMVEHFGTVWINPSVHGTFNVYVYEEKGLKKTDIGTQKTLADSLKVQAKFCKEHKIVNKNKRVNIEDVVVYEKRGV
jgi:hypothetical protein